MSFRLKTIIGVATIEALLLLFLIWTGINYLRTSNETELLKRASSTLTLLTRASQDAVLSTDIATLEDIASEAIKTPELAYVRILDNRGIVLAEAGDALSSSQPFREDYSLDDVDDEIFDSKTEILLSNTSYGSIEIGLSTTHLDDILRNAKKNAAAIALLEMGLVALFSLALGIYLTRQLYSLTAATGRITDGDYGYQIRIRGNDELAQTAVAFNRMSAELKHDREKKDAILRSALDAIVAMDEQGCIVEFNQAAETTFGYRREDVTGKLMKDMIIPPSLREAHEKGMAHYLATGESPIMDRRIQVTAMRANGDEFPAELAVTAVDINGTKLFTAFMRDISDRVQREAELHAAKQAAEAADKAKTLFLANMSHEIRTPLNALLGFLGLLREQNNISKEQLAWIRTAQQSGASLMHLINETLDFSKIEAGKLELEPHDFDIRELINSTMAVLSPKTTAKSVDFTADIANNVPERIREDSARLRQVLINLLDNAIKFTDAGNIELTVKVGEQNGPPCLRFDVSDTGRGIPPNAHDAVFGEFTRLAEAGKLTSGTGLGLSITRRLVEIMGGRIDFENRDSGGTRFWFEIPLTPAMESAELPEPGSMLEENTSLLKGRILLADDSPANQMLALAMLQDSGCTIDTVSDGLEAVEAVRALPYDLVLMDISMPEMDGLEATGAIRALPGTKGQIPIIAMTAHAIVGDREKFMAAGMNDYLSKPVTKQRLYETLNKWLQVQQTNQPVRTKMTAPGQSPDQILDTSVFEQLARDTSEEIVPKMLDAFCRETRERITRLKQPGESEIIGLEELQHETHTLKSSAATFGAARLHRLARDVEAACRDARESDARNMLGELIDSGEQAISAIEDHLAGLPSRQAKTANP